MCDKLISPRFDPADVAKRIRVSIHVSDDDGYRRHLSLAAKLQALARCISLRIKRTTLQYIILYSSGSQVCYLLTQGGSHDC